MQYYMALIVMTLIGAFAGFCLKRASVVTQLKMLIINPFLYTGGILYLLSAIINIYVLKYLDYSIVLPLTSITYIWTFILSYLFLKESISRKKMLGIILIIGGASMLAWGH